MGVLLGNQPLGKCQAPGRLTAYGEAQLLDKTTHDLVILVELPRTYKTHFSRKIVDFKNKKAAH